MNLAIKFSNQDHSTWQQLFSQQSLLREKQVVSVFSNGLKFLEINENEIPDIFNLNKKLKAISGWQAVYTDGFVEPVYFFEMLSQKRFPVGNFIRDPKNLSYTPAPDVFHDLYGHIPFYTDTKYAEFCRLFGASALKFKRSAEAIEAFQRLFWFTIEFGLLKTSNGNRIFGAGIVSSFSECAYALSDKPRVHKFDIKKIRDKDFRIDVIQEDLFILDSVDQLYNSISGFENLLHVESL